MKRSVDDTLPDGTLSIIDFIEDEVVASTDKRFFFLRQVKL